MTKARIITKMLVTPLQLQALYELGIKEIPQENPKNPQDTAEISARIADAEAIITGIYGPINRAVMDQCPELRFIQTWSTGLDHIDLIAAKEKNIIVKNVPDFSVEAVAERTLALLLMLAGKLKQANADLLAGNWNYVQFRGIEIRDKNLLLIGKGKIATRVDELARAFGTKVFFVDSKTPKAEFYSLLAQADFISLHCPLNTTTYHLISSNEFLQIKKGAILINTARGGVVDEDALLQALNTGVISYAALDVFEKEPPDTNHSLIHHPQVFATPHMTWHTAEAVEKLSEVSIQNLRDFLHHICHCER